MDYFKIKDLHYKKKTLETMQVNRTEMLERIMDEYGTK